MLNSRHARWLPLLVAAVMLSTMTSIDACPFCAAVSQTIDEEMEAMQVVAFATLEHAADWDDRDSSEGELPLSRFRITEILKGDAALKVGREIEIAYFGPNDKSYTYLVQSPEQSALAWGNPLLLTADGVEYVRKLPTLPKDHTRLRFFIQYLEHKDELLSRDAYDEFAKAPYADVIALKDAMDRETLLKWIQDENVTIEHRRLYLTMLGICGTPEDANILADMITSPDVNQRSGLNALIAAYLSLRGAAGLPLINEQFLSNEDAEYSDIHAAIMAVRFHGNESDVIPREELLKSMHLVLKRKDIADLVIPDLARWEDWTVLPQLIDLFVTADPKSNWVRVPVVNYVRACPLPEAKVAMEKLTEVDADAVRRASALFPFVTGTPPTGENADPSTENAATGVPSAGTATPPGNPLVSTRPTDRDPRNAIMAPSDTTSRLFGMPAQTFWLSASLLLFLLAMILSRLPSKT